MPLLDARKAASDRQKAILMELVPDRPELTETRNSSCQLKDVEIKDIER